MLYTYTHVYYYVGVVVRALAASRRGADEERSYALASETSIAGFDFLDKSLISYVAGLAQIDRSTSIMRSSRLRANSAWCRARLRDYNIIVSLCGPCPAISPTYQFRFFLPGGKACVRPIFPVDLFPRTVSHVNVHNFPTVLYSRSKAAPPRAIG